MCFEVGNTLEGPTRWDALKGILFYREKRRAIGPAWPLYFYLIFQGDPANRLVTSYPRLVEDLGESADTLKKWKEGLIERGVLENKQASHGMILSLVPPFDAPVTALRDDWVELRLRSDAKTRHLLKTALGADSMALLPIVADLAKKVELLESKKSL